MSLTETIPIFINCRDRLTPLLQLLAYLERAGAANVHLVDNASTYPPLLDFYSRTSHRVIRLEQNLGHKALWQGAVLEQAGVDGRFVLSDPDVVPIEECPLDAIEYFAEMLDRYPRRPKVGFGLKVDDLPAHFRHKQEVIDWEAHFWQKPLAPGLYEAQIDTTFALYRAPGKHAYSAIRTGHPYLARHTTWYLDSDDLSDEERYYRDRARADVMSWSGVEIPERLTERIAGIRERSAPEAPPSSEGADGIQTDV
jgi:hypothetical protein